MKPLKGGLAAGLMLGTLGFKVKGVTARDVINDSEYFSEILARNKMIGFIGLNPTDEEHEELLKALYRGDSSSLSPGLLHDQCHRWNEKTATDEELNFIMQNWHVDNPFLPDPPSFTSMHMRTFDVPHGRGRTYLASLSSMYDVCPDRFKTHLETARFIHNTGSVNESGTSTDALAHSALRTHPVTGETMIYWTGGDTSLEGEGDWFVEFKLWVERFLADGNNWYIWEWTAGDFIIWDNRAVIHSLGPGWTHDQRIFTRGEVGRERCFYDTTTRSLLNPLFGDIVRHSSVSQDSSYGPNPDHIPLVFTKGIYGLPGLEKYYQQTTMFVYSSDGSIPEDVVKLKDIVENTEFNVVAVDPSPGNFLERYSKRILPGQQIEGQKFLFTPNGNLEKAYKHDDDLFTDEFDDQGRWPPIRLINALGEFHPDLRHAGHAWHYPDWFPHQPLRERPWDWHNLSFTNYEGFPGSEPPFDYLVQFAVDTVYGCFNHYKTNEQRKEMIEAIIDYLSFMLALGEHEADR